MPHSIEPGQRTQNLFGNLDLKWDILNFIYKNANV